MSRKVNILKNYDWFSVILFVILVFLGWINIYAAVFSDEHQSILDFEARYGKQFLWIGFAFLLAFIVSFVDTHFYNVFAYHFYVVLVLLLVGVLIFGTEVNNSKSWFDLGFFRFQPAELAKFATSLALARFLSTYDGQIHKTNNLLQIIGLLGVPALLILFQNDTGSALVYFAFVIVLFREGLTGNVLLLGLLSVILFIMSLLTDFVSIISTLTTLSFVAFFIARPKPKEGFIGLGIFLGITAILWAVNELFLLAFSPIVWIATALIISFLLYLYFAFRYRIFEIYYILIVFIFSLIYVGSVGYIFNNLLEPHHQTRINVLFGIEEDIRDAGYNVHQSKVAIGSGGVFGKGFLEGTQTKYNFVPEQSTDFIFCTIGEEWGFVGSIIVLLLFLTLLLRIVFLAERQRSVFARVYGYCVATVLFFHIAVNIGMTIGLVPVIGIPLPFFSYGGSSLWAFTILLFIFLRFDASRLELQI